MSVALDEMHEASDETLLLAYARGDAAAARALTLRLTPRVLGQAFRRLGDRAEAEDVTQEALLRLWRFAPAYRPDEAKVSTWLYRVVANLCTDRLRRRKPALDLDSVPEPEDGRASAAEALQERHRQAALRAALAELPERQREAVVLRHLDGLGNQEIAEIMDISARAVESLTARGKRALAASLAARRGELGYGDE